MSRIVCILLSIYVLTISAIPCHCHEFFAVPEESVAEECPYSLHASHENHHNSDGCHDAENCTPFCSCSHSVNFQTNTTFDFEPVEVKHQLIIPYIEPALQSCLLKAPHPPI